jgi:hypothetical protein
MTASLHQFPPMPPGMSDPYTPRNNALSTLPPTYEGSD